MHTIDNHFPITLRRDCIGITIASSWALLLPVRLLPLYAKPHIAHVIRALNSKSISGIVVGTENRQIAKYSRQRGADRIIHIDVDEIIAAHAVAETRRLAHTDDNCMYRFRKIWLWKSERYWRVDKPEKYSAYSNTSIMVRYSPGIYWPRALYPQFERVHASIHPSPRSQGGFLLF